MSVYAVEKGIPFPPPTNKGPKGRPLKSALLMLLRKLEIGDSVLIENADEAHEASSRIRHWPHMRFTMRKGRDGWRVWRTE